MVKIKLARFGDHSVIVPQPTKVEKDSRDFGEILNGADDTFLLLVMH